MNKILATTASSIWILVEEENINVHHMSAVFGAKRQMTRIATHSEGDALTCGFIRYLKRFYMLDANPRHDHLRY